MNELCEQLLAGAALTREKYRRVGRGHAAGQGDRLAEQGRIAQHGEPVAVGGFRRARLFQGARLPRHQHRVRGASDQDLQLRAREGLRQVIPGPLLERFEARGDRGVPGHDDDDDAGLGGEREAQQLAPRHLPHVPVHQGDVKGAAPDRVARFVPPPAHRDAVALGLEHAEAAFAQRALVIDHQNANARSRGGIDGRENGQRRGTRRGGTQRAIHVGYPMWRGCITSSRTSKLWYWSSNY